MSLSAPELEAVVDELQALVGGTIQKIAGPTARTVILELRIPGATHQLLVCAEPDETRIHLLAGSRPPSPPSPLPIQNLLRAHLLPSRLVGLEVLPGERVVELRFDTPTGPMILMAELTGRHGNLFLLGNEGRILGAAVHSASTTRTLSPGRRYTSPPPRPPAGSPGARGSGPLTPPRFGGEFVKNSQTLASGRRANEEEPSRAERELKESHPSQRGQSLHGLGAADQAKASFPLSGAIEAQYGPLASERLLAEQRRETGRAIAAAGKRVETALTKIRGDEERAREAEGMRRLGDLLTPIAGRIPRGARSVTATDYTEAGPVEVEVPLRPELTGRENLERYYKQYRRLSTARERIARRREELTARRSLLRSLAERAEAAATGAALEEVAREAVAVGARQSRQAQRRGEEQRTPYRSFTSETGRSIFVGKGARENDSLTFRVAKGNDLWLHARGQPGAHVVVPFARGAPVDEQTLLDACALAAHFSGAKGEAVAEIAYTQVRNVRKPKGSAPGAVTHTQEKSKAYRHDEARIARLLAQQ